MNKHDGKKKNYRREKVWNTADEHTVEFWFFDSPMETKIGAKNQRVRETGDNGVVFKWGEENEFWFKLSGGLKRWGFKKLRFHCSLMVNKEDAML